MFDMTMFEMFLLMWNGMLTGLWFGSYFRMNHVQGQIDALTYYLTLKEERQNERRDQA